MDTSSARPDFWNVRYSAGQTPWDYGGVPAALQRFLARTPGGRSVLIPGCGSGHEIAAFAAAGFAVTAIDFSPPAVALARDRLGPELASRVIEGDFFTHPLPRSHFDVIYERTFLCALPPALRPQIAARLAELIAPQGRLVGLYFIGIEDDGPPFAITEAEAAALFDPYFHLHYDVAVPGRESPPLFVDRERWQERTVRART